MTHEYLRAVEGYRLSYTELKRMTRQSVEHSFLPGAEPVGARRRLHSALWPHAQREPARSEKALRRMREISRRQRTRARTMEAGSRVREVREKVLKAIKTNRVPHFSRLFARSGALAESFERNAPQTHSNPVSPRLVARSTFRSRLRCCRCFADRGGTQLRTPLPVAIVDTREQNPLSFRRFQRMVRRHRASRPTVSATIPSSGMEDSCVVERKDLADLIQSFTTNRASSSPACAA